MTGLFKAFVGCFEQPNEVVLADSMEGEEMELRECECGDKKLLMNFTCAETGKYRVLCAGEDCWRMTALQETEQGAIRAWNEGEVEQEIA